MLRQSNPFVDSEIIGDNQHEVLEGQSEVIVSRNGNNDEDDSSDQSPDEARDLLRPSSENLQTKSERVNVGAVVRDDAQSENDHAEFAEATKLEQDNAEKTTDRVLGVRIKIGCVIDSRGRDRETEPLGEAKRKEQAAEHANKNLDRAGVGWLVDRVVSSIGRPAGSKAENGAGEGKEVTRARGAHDHGNVVKVSGVSKGAKKDEEHDEAGNPTPELVHMNDLVAEQSDQECAETNDYDSSKRRNVAIDGVDDLGSNNDVRRRPSQTRQSVEDSNYKSKSVSNLRPAEGPWGKKSLTHLDAVVSKKESRHDHLPQPELGTEGREKGDWQDAKDIDEQDNQEAVNEAQVVDGDSEGTDGETADNHIGGQPLEKGRPLASSQTVNLLTTYHCCDLGDSGVGTLIFRDTLNTSSFYTIVVHLALKLGVETVASDEGLRRDGAGLVDMVAMLLRAVSMLLDIVVVFLHSWWVR